MGTPLVAPELDHHREREGRVADEHDEEDLRTRGEHELEPDDDREADGRRPPTESRRVLGEVPRRHAQPPDDRGPEVVDGRERVEVVPDRPDERRDHRHADPAVDPHEERGDLGVALPADDALDDDPQPREQPDRTQDVAQRRRRHPAVARRIGPLGADVADEHEDEREGDGGCGAGQVDGERQPARVGRVQRVGEDRRGCGKPDRSDDRESGGQPGAATGHSGLVGPESVGPESVGPESVGPESVGPESVGPRRRESR